jgi:predicted DNA-binding antitoxin AbrB/MazE fold protein
VAVKSVPVRNESASTSSGLFFEKADPSYQNGVFKPLQDVRLPDNQRVRLCIQPLEAADVRAWLAEVQEMRQRIIAERGCFPDSTPDIAEDRRR